MRLALFTLAIVVCAGSLVLAQAPAPSAAPASADPGLRVTYVGNAGFLVECGGRKVLIDALYRAGVPGYQVHAPETLEKLEWARPPFDAVDLVLVTHLHNDHFDPVSTGKYLIENRQARLFTTPQAADRMLREFPGFSAVSARVQAVYPPEGEKKTFDLDGIKLTAMTMHHGRDVPHQNVAFLIEIGGRKLLHLGDTQISHADMGRYGLVKENIDVAFVPFWILIEAPGVKMMRDAVAAKKVVPMHLPVETAPSLLFGSGIDRKGTLTLLRSIPGVILFDAPLESREL